MMNGLRGWFLEQLAMYAAYHRDRRNQLTHHVGVPLIVFSPLLALNQASLIIVASHAVTAGALLLAALLLLYVVAVPVVGLIAVVFYGAMYGVVTLVSEQSADRIWVVVAVCFIGGWIIQFVGHIFEGRRPALTVNALQVFMAPPFLIAEVLFVLGFQSWLRREIETRALKYSS
jgi:uncharacterized membrane protein YGL010W